MKIDAEKLVVTHNEAEKLFEVWIDGHLSKLEYILDDDTIVMTHVGVYPEHRGQAVAAKLVQSGLEYARANSLRVIPMCPYVGVYMRRNPQYNDLLEPDKNALV